MASFSNTFNFSNVISYTNLRPNLTSSNLTSIKDIEKCGWLNLENNLNSDKNLNHLKTKNCYQKLWAIFYVLNKTLPFLEFHLEEQPFDKNLINPVAKFLLKDCLHVFKPILYNDQENQNEFIIILESQTIKIFVDDSEQLEEWIECLKNKLISLNIIKSKENIYSKEPVPSVKKNFVQSLRPLPPIPLEEINRNQTEIHSQNLTNRFIRLRIPSGQVRTNNSETNCQINSSSNLEVFNNNNNLPLNSNSLMPTSSRRQDQNLLSSFLNQINQPNQLNSQITLSLRESQILTLKKEISHRGGIKLIVKKKDCYNSLALVEWLGCVWVAGWKQKLYPQFHNIFHIGDQIVLVDDKKIGTINEFYDIIKNNELLIKFIIKRVPYGKPFLIKRDYNGQDLGIICKGNTAEIIFIVENSLAHEYEIPNKAKTVDPLKYSECNWIITEINNRPLNLFFKNDEIKDRLNAVGNEISLLLQPSDLIKNLKKKLKSMKNYKEYIVQ